MIKKIEKPIKICDICKKEVPHFAIPEKGGEWRWLIVNIMFLRGKEAKLQENNPIFAWNTKCL